MFSLKSGPFLRIEQKQFRQSCLPWKCIGSPKVLVSVWKFSEIKWHMINYVLTEPKFGKRNHMIEIEKKAMIRNGIDKIT